MVEQGDGTTYSLQHLQQRLHDFVGIALDGGLASKYPESRGKSVVIRLDCYDTPRDECERLLFLFAEQIHSSEEIQSTVAKHGYIKDIEFEFKWNTLANEA